MAISRYDGFRTVKDDKKGVLRLETFSSVKASEIEDPNNDIIIEYNDGDRLDKIAFDYLGDGRYWWAICLLNDLSLPFGGSLEPGTRLRVPTNIDNISNYIRNKLDSKE